MYDRVLMTGADGVIGRVLREALRGATRYCVFPIADLSEIQSPVRKSCWPIWTALMKWMPQWKGWMPSFTWVARPRRGRGMWF